MWKSIDILCENCGVRDQTVDVPYGSPLPDEAICEACGATATRKLSATIAKKQIEERTWGGQIINGQVWRRATGWKTAERQHELDTARRRAMKKGDKDTATEIAREQVALQEQSKKNVGKAEK